MKGDVPVLERLGPVPFWRGENKCIDGLERIYHRAMDGAKAKLVEVKVKK